uniref:RNA repair pathway protein n=1 Tax=Siphoviridae sp. ctLqe90 TaxID=2825456 RepID=A0A8S5Q1K3_9CAUD|nr:MAG TPA: RNA repair pathway protein [Siphoviridae sp. ctLqe90]
MNLEKVNNRVHSDYEFLKELGYNIVGVFVYGSNNYGMATEHSDVDTKAIVLPHFDDIVDSKDWVSKEYHRDEDGGKLEVKDIRLMFNSYLKQNINFTETLFTKYFELNPEYAGMWLGAVIKNREAIAHYCPHKAVLTMYGNMKTKYKQMFHRAPHNEFDIDNYGYGLKDFHHIARLADFIKRYIAEDETYEKILIPKDPELLISYKTTPLPVEDAKKIAESLITEAEVLVDEYVMDKHFETDKEVEDVLRNVQRTMIANSLKKELLESETKL